MKSLALSLTESVLETPKVILTFESVAEILWCDHSNETSSAELSHGTIYGLGFYKNEIWYSSWILILILVKELRGTNQVEASSSTFLCCRLFCSTRWF